MMKKILVLLLLPLVCGCVTAPKYPTNELTYSSDVRLNYNIAINTFQDVRPDSERLKDIGHERIGFYTNDKSFKSRLNELVPEKLSKELKKTRIFSEVNTVNFSYDIDQKPAEMQSLLDQGYDLVIMGTITHCVGYQLTESSGGTAFGAMGVLFDAMSNPRIVGSHVEYNPLKIVDLRQQRVIFGEKINYSYETQDTFYKGPYSYAIKGIKGANQKVISTLVDILE